MSRARVSAVMAAVAVVGLAGLAAAVAAMAWWQATPSGASLMAGGGLVPAATRQALADVAYGASWLALLAVAPFQGLLMTRRPVLPRRPGKTHDAGRGSGDGRDGCEWVSPWCEPCEPAGERAVRRGVGPRRVVLPAAVRASASAWMVLLRHDRRRWAEVPAAALPEMRVAAGDPHPVRSPARPTRGLETDDDL